MVVGGSTRRKRVKGKKKGKRAKGKGQRANKGGDKSKLSLSQAD